MAKSNQAAMTQLQRMLEQLSGLFQNKLKVGISRQLSEQAIAEVHKGFREGRDPYGTPWAPPMFRMGRPLRDSGRLRNSFTWQSARASGFRVGSNVIYAPVHQYGAVIKAKPGKSLRFAVPVQGPAMGVAKRGGGYKKAAAVGIGSSFVYAQSVTIPMRRMMPIQSLGLGATWQRSFNRAASRILRKHFAKG